MSESPAPYPIPTPNNFNTDFFFNIGNALTFETASKYFLSKSGGNITYLNCLGNLDCGTLSIAGAAVDLSSLSGLTAGTVTASKLVLVDANKDITGFRNLTTTSSITSLGSSNSSPLYLTNTSSSSTFLVSIDSVSGDQTIGSNTANKFHLRSNGTRKLTIGTTGLVGINNTSPTRQLDIVGSTAVNNALYQITDGTVTYQQWFDGTQCCLQTFNNYPLTFATNNGAAQLSILTNGNVSVANTLSTTTLALSGAISGATSIGSSGTITVTRTTNGQSFNSTNGTSICALYHFNNADVYFGNTTANNLILQTNNTARMTINGNTGDITGISALTATNLTGTLQTAAQPNITSLGTLTGLTLSGAITGITSLTATTSLTVSNGNTPLSLRNVSSARGLDISIQSTGTYNTDIKLVNDQATGLLSLYANGSRQITLINNANNVNFPNHNGSTTGIQLAGTLITSTASELNYLSGLTLGTITASKAITVDASSNINSILNLTKSANSNQIVFTNGTSIASLYQITNSTVYLGTTSANDFMLVSNNTNRVNIESGGAMNILSGWKISSSSVNSTAAELNYLNTVSAGTAAASKALVLDSSRNLTNVGKVNFTSSDATTTTGTTTASQFGLNILSTVNTNGQYNSAAIAFLNAASDAIPHGVILSQRTAAAAGDLVFLTRSASNNLSECARVLSTGALAVNATAVAGITCIGSSNYTDGGYQKLLDLQSNNVSPIDFCIEVNSGTNATSTNATWIGNLTNNDLRFGVNNSTKMILDSNGRLGIGTNGPGATLSVSGTVSNTYNTGGQLYAIGSSTQYLTSQLGPVTVSVAADFGGPIRCTSIYCTSDRRCKEQIELLDSSYCDKFYELDIYQYKYKGTEETIPKIGFLSQDLNKAGYINLLSLTPNENLKAEEEGDIEGAQMNIDYTKITALNAMMIKKLLKKIEELENKINSLTQV